MSIRYSERFEGIKGVAWTRRRLVKNLVSLAPVALTTRTRATEQSAPTGMPESYSPSILPAGIRSRFVDNVNGLRVHVLEAGFGAGSRPCVLLLHGFPELAFSWRKVMGPLAAAGFHVLAPDLRGYGRTTGWDDRYATDLRSFGLLNYVRDAFGLVSAFGYHSVAAVVGHDFGSVVAPWQPRYAWRPDKPTWPFLGELVETSSIGGVARYRFGFRHSIGIPLIYDAAGLCRRRRVTRRK